VEAIDCSERITTATVMALKNSGIRAIGRYLGYKTEGWSKSLTLNELKIIQSAGLSVFLIWESNPTTAEYFSYSKGLSDAQSAIEEAVYLGAPSGSTAIYFTVDFDAQTNNMAAIIEYFKGIREELNGRYLAGVYGSYNVMQTLQASSYAPDRYFQTYTWSSGKVFSNYHIYQYQNNVNLQEIAVDRDKIQYKSGCWPELEEFDMQLDYLVIYFGDADLQIAADLAMYYQCPLVQVAYATAELLAAVKIKYQVGGSTAPTGVTLLGGLDRFETIKAVLGVMGKL
jgi:hypothetical protein